MSKHTPGPWLVEETTVYFLDWDGQSYWPRSQGGGAMLTNRFSCSVQGQQKRISREELEANARLIAAAPEMLEALRMVVRHLHAPGGDGYEELLAAERAIAKAEGK